MARAERTERPRDDGGHGRGGDAGARTGGQALSTASRRAAREGVGRGLRALYADTVCDPVPDDLMEILGRLAPAAG